jgi:hypothetical protein
MLFTDCSILVVCLSIISLQLSPPAAAADEESWIRFVGMLDHAIIKAGAAGPSRMDMIQSLIRLIQQEYLPFPSASYSGTSALHQNPIRHPEEIIPPLANLPIQSYTSPISLTRFTSHLSSPFILKGFISDWPAVERWSSPEHLLQIAGRGRVVPVEVGVDYTNPDWSQEVIPWESFIAHLFPVSQTYTACPTTPLEPNIGLKETVHEVKPRYLAQHSLLSQIPELHHDIIMPDYVYASPSPPSYFPSYKTPSNEDELVINAWIGPAGTVTPAHTVS